MNSTASRIEEFKRRVALEPAHCEELFLHATIRLLAHKYAYYILHEPYIKDYAFDIEEQSWYIMGIALGLLTEDQTSPCIDFSYDHPQAQAGIEMALKFTGRKK